MYKDSKHKIGGQPTETITIRRKRVREVTLNFIKTHKEDSQQVMGTIPMSERERGSMQGKDGTSEMESIAQATLAKDTK